MAKLSNEKIAAEVKEKGFTFVSADNYTNLNSLIKVRCPNAHDVEVSMADFRRPSFECPVCNKSIHFDNPINVPPKAGYRIIAFDQATENFGLSIWDNGQLSFFHLYVFTGNASTRLLKIKKFIETVVIKEWKPDFIVFEDIQYQHGAVLTYKILAMLLGVIQTVCEESNIPYEIVSPNVWRKYMGTCGKNRREEKLLSVATVKQKFHVNVSDDIAEAILIGNYAAKAHKPTLKSAFGTIK